MKKVGLFYFSGTGNTELVANHICDEFAQLDWNVSMFNIENIKTKSEMPDIEEFDLIGIGSPVIGYTTPRCVNQFIKLLPVSQKGKKVFVFRTCGGVSETNYTASHYLMKALQKKNYDVFYERLFSIGSNWVFKFDDAIMKQLYEATKRKIRIMCKEVTNGVYRKYRTTFGLRLKKRFISDQSKIMFTLLGKDMRVSEDCIKCGICVRDCPGKNISLVNGKIKFKMNCSACLRCVYKCPTNAIGFKFLKFIPIKNGYDVKKSLSMESNLKEEANGKVPAFFNDYVSQDNL